MWHIYRAFPLCCNPRLCLLFLSKACSWWTSTVRPYLLGRWMRLSLRSKTVMATSRPRPNSQRYFPSPLIDDFQELLTPFPELAVDSVRGRQRLSGTDEEQTKPIMSLALLKGIFSRYSPLAEEFPSGDPEKEAQLPFQKEPHDLESTPGSESSGSSLNQNERGEKNSFKIVDARIVSDAIIGLSDGMTVPFALTAGLSALGDTKVVVFGGMAELIAGAISMGLGGYLGAKSEEESYRATLKETRQQTVTDPSSVATTISDIFAPYDLPSNLLTELTTHLSESPNLPSFLMNFHHTLHEPSGSRALICALTIAVGYFVGGFVPLLPYFFVGPHEAFIALHWSIATMVVALFLFGYGKTCFVSGWKGTGNVRRGVIGGVQMVLVGGVAAGSAMGLVKAFQAIASDSPEST